MKTSQLVLATFALNYEDIQKSPYWYKHQYEKRLKQRQDEFDAFSLQITKIYHFIIKSLQRALKWLAVAGFYALALPIKYLTWGLLALIELIIRKKL